MKLRTEFVRLPLDFDADRMLCEVEALDTGDLVAHPTDRTNLAAILISVGGTTNDEFAIAGEMRPTPLLQRCSYLRQVLASFRTELSRARLMILPPGTRVATHDDVCYHWYRRTRIHVPILTNPLVTFSCNDKSVHMRAGEAWIFDNFLPHEVVNDGETTRVHLVADTKGTDAFWDLVARGADPHNPGELANVRFDYVMHQPAAEASLRIEPYMFEVLTPAEVNGFIEQILADVHGGPSAALARPVEAGLAALSTDWTKAFAVHGHDRSGLAEYSAILIAFARAPFTRELRRCVRPHSPADIALRVLCSVFTPTNRSAVYAPDLELANIATADMKAHAAASGTGRP